MFVLWICASSTTWSSVPEFSMKCNEWKYRIAKINYFNPSNKMRNKIMIHIQDRQSILLQKWWAIKFHISAPGCPFATDLNVRKCYHWRSAIIFSNALPSLLLDNIQNRTTFPSIRLLEWLLKLLKSEGQTLVKSFWKWKPFS